MSVVTTVAGTAVYLAGYFPTARRTYIQFDETDPIDNSMNMVAAAFVALFWPLVLVWSALKAIVFQETPRQRRIRLDRERAEAARLAADHKLPMPDVEVGPW